MALEKWLPPEKIQRKPEAETVATEKKSANGVNETGGESDHFLDALGHIAEINTEIGLNHVSGVKKLYFESVALFCKNLVMECEKMSAFLNNSDIANFSISVHAMKSILATIGAPSLSESALKLETASKKKEYDYCVQYYPELKEKLLSLHARLSLFFPEVKDDFAKQKGDSAYLRIQIEKARAAADNFDGDTGIEAINSLLAYDFGGETNLVLNNTLEAFKNFDFEGAVEKMKLVGSG
jgi:HPt (histidine-containing phosphotransfer) domain-containing protein